MEVVHSFEGRIAEQINHSAGSMGFIYFHVVWFGLWILINQGYISDIPVFDPFPYGLLTMIVSLEAIFLSTFILVAQNRLEMLDTLKELEEDIEEIEEDKEIADIQSDLEEIKKFLSTIQNKLSKVEQTEKKS